MAQISDDNEGLHSLLDDRQQLFVLNFAANAVGTKTGTQDYLEKLFEDALRRMFLVSQWKLAWGPKVFKTDPNNSNTYPTNAWYVATKAGKCVLAIAGTAPKSRTGWSQNFDIQNTVQWDKWVSKWPNQGEIPAPQIDEANDSVPTIAHGTAQGVRNVLTKKSTRAASGTYVQDFLKKQPAGTEIYVVGHSMGGALAPAVALGLVQSKMITDKNVRVVASAGASPGNSRFAQACESNLKFKDGNFYNTKDVVPQAWQVAGGQDRCFPNVYDVIFKDQDEKPREQIKKLTKEAEEVSLTSGIKYAPVLGDAFTSDIPIGKVESIEDPKFREIVHEQHITAYLRKLGIPKLIKAFEEDLDNSENTGHQLHGVENESITEDD